MNMRRFAGTIFVILAALFTPRPGRAAAPPPAPRTSFAVVIGNNRSLGNRRPDLHYADDDAAAFYDLMADIADSAHLLAVMDSETQARFPKLAKVARPPSVGELRVALERLEERIESNRRRGDQRRAGSGSRACLAVARPGDGGPRRCRLRQNDHAGPGGSPDHRSCRSGPDSLRAQRKRDRSLA